MINTQKVEKVAEEIRRIPCPPFPIQDWLPQDVEEVAYRILKLINDNDLTLEEMFVLDDFVAGRTATTQLIDPLNVY